MLVVMFFEKPGLGLIKQRQFVLLRAQTNLAISPEAWSTSVAPGDKLAMSMAVRRTKPPGVEDAAGPTCPRCNYRLELTLQAFHRGHTW
jgi:hypothetical protein